MLTRRAWLASMLPPAQACYCLCGFEGEFLQQSAGCGARQPGSTVKPLLGGLLNPAWRFACRRTLRVGGHRLDCAHMPLPGPQNLETALAVSCNSWFAQAADRLDGIAVQRTLQSWGAQATLPRTREELVLEVLGLERVWFTPAALARAYARVRQGGPDVVRRGLEAAVLNGTAADGGYPGLLLAGKTGTVRAGAWFAGWSSRAVVAVFVPGGTGGADAAPAAREILRKWHAGSPA